MTTAQKYLKGAVAPGGRQFFFLICATASISCQTDLV